MSNAVLVELAAIRADLADMAATVRRIEELLRTHRPPDAALASCHRPAPRPGTTTTATT